MQNERLDQTEIEVLLNALDIASHKLKIKYKRDWIEQKMVDIKEKLHQEQQSLAQKK